jgi:hypothetical protein
MTRQQYPFTKERKCAAKRPKPPPKKPRKKKSGAESDRDEEEEVQSDDSDDSDDWDDSDDGEALVVSDESEESEESDEEEDLYDVFQEQPHISGQSSTNPQTPGHESRRPNPQYTKSDNIVERLKRLKINPEALEEQTPQGKAKLMKNPEIVANVMIILFVQAILESSRKTLQKNVKDSLKSSKCYLE